MDLADRVTQLERELLLMQTQLAETIARLVALEKALAAVLTGK